MGAHIGLITHSVTSSDPNYNDIPVDSITVNITDNDVAGVTISGSPAVTEGGATDTYTVVLDTEPMADVTITITVDAQVTTDKSELVFTPENWNTPQTVTVEAVDDDTVEGNHTGTITHTATSTDPKYNGIEIDDVVVSITDNDAAGVSIIESGGSTDVEEGGATDTYQIVLTSKPSADVTINITVDDQITVDKSSVTFTPENWNVPQTVTVTAVDDDIDD